MVWYEIFMVIGIPSIISGLVALLLNRGMKARDARQEEIVRQNEKMEEQNKAVIAGIQAMLRDRLLQAYRHYDEKGYADYEDKQNVENLYRQYHTLGANGVMDGMRKKFLTLPDYPKAE